MVLLAIIGCALQDEADVLITGGTVYDGTGAAPQKITIAIKGERIVKADRARRTIDASGLIVCPGFIDLHTHSDTPILADATRSNLNYLAQGVTLVVTGNCGYGHVDVAEYLGKIRAGTNVAHQIPHGSVRKQVMGEVNRAPTPEELRRMRELVERAMTDGAFGMSTGLIYVPGTYAKTDELVELAKVVARHGGYYASHIRDEGSKLLEAVEEAIEIGRQAGCPVHISHMKASGRSNWGKVKEAAAKIDEARKAGQSVTADQYPYIASSTTLEANLVPAEFREGGRTIERLDDPRIRRHILDVFEKRLAPENIMIANFSKDSRYNGKTLAAIAADAKKEPVDAALDILRRGGASGIFFNMNEDDVRRAMQNPWVATASDGSARAPDKTHPHPRLYGTFARKIGRYSIELGLLPLEQAIHSASGLPASVLGLKDRGVLREGAFADVAVFDPKTFRDAATFESPHQYAPGMRFVWVNGSLAIDEGKYAGALAGRALRRAK